MLKKIDYKYYLIILFLFVIFLGSWNSDDAFHGFVMIRNLLNGNGFVYNIGERVNAATCPLFYLLIAAISFFTKELFLTTVVFCMVLSTISYAIILFNCCKEKWQSFALTFILLFCNSFNSFATSGLENSLLFLEEILFFYILTKNEKYNFKQLFLLAFVCGCLLITRTDAGILLFFSIAYCFLFKRNCSFIKMFFAGVLGLMPFICWSIFSWFYYGLIFPNTYYIKLNTGLEKIEYIKKGIEYFGVTFFYDCLVIIIPLIAMIILFMQKNLKFKFLGIGFFMKFLYLIYIGGDFMVGRHFTDLFILGMFVILYFINNIKKEEILNKISNTITYFILIVIGFTVVIRPVISENFYTNKRIVDCCDERAFYYKDLGTISYIYSLLKEEISYEDLLYKIKVDNYKDSDTKGMFLQFAPGILVLEYGDCFYVTDPIGLGDPLFSKLPAKFEENWRIGHIEREIPEGYKESVEQGKNLIRHSTLHEYYDIFHSIISDDLFDKNRINKLINFSIGKYDYLIEKYIEDLED